MFEQCCYPKENVSILYQIFQDLKQQGQIHEREDQSQQKQVISSINNLVVQFQQEKEFKVDQFKIALELLMDLIKKNDKCQRKSIQIKAWNNYAKKFIKEYDIVELYLQFFSIFNHDQEDIEDEISIIIEIFKYYTSDQEHYLTMIDQISDWSFQNQQESTMATPY